MNGWWNVTILTSFPEHFLSFHVLLPWTLGAGLQRLDTHRSASRNDPGSPGTSTPHRPTPQGAQLEKGQSFLVCGALCLEHIDWDQQLIPPLILRVFNWHMKFCVLFCFVFHKICWSPRRPTETNPLEWSSDGGFWNERGPGSSLFHQHWGPLTKRRSIEPREWSYLSGHFNERMRVVRQGHQQGLV